MDRRRCLQQQRRWLGDSRHRGTSGLCCVRGAAKPGACIITDELKSYDGLADSFRQNSIVQVRKTNDAWRIAGVEFFYKSRRSPQSHRNNVL
jgi:hypothetical protein